MRRQTLLALSAVAMFAAACDSTSRNPAGTPFSPPQNPVTARFQIIHASADAPAVNVTGIPSPISGADFKDASGARTVTAGTYDITVEGILPDGSTTPVIGPAAVPLDADTFTTILAIGNDLAITPLILTQPDTAVPAGNTRLRVVHAAADAPEVSVFLTAPGADLTAEMPVDTFEFGEDAGPVEVPAGGPYQIRVTLPFTPPAAPTVVFDSGEIDLPDGASLLVAAVDNTLSADGIEMGDSPISLILTAGAEASEITDVATAAELRVVHASADTPAVDIIVNDDLMAPLVDALTYPNFAPAPTGFVEVPADTYDISVVDDATQTAEPINLDGVALDAGVTYDILAINEFANVAPLILTDDYRRLETAAKVRIIHASTAADAASPMGVDIYVTDPTVTDLTGLMPTIDNFMYEANTGFIELAPGDYVVTVTADGSTMPLIQTPTLTLDANGIYTAIARDPDPAVANDVPGLILLDDFN